MEVERCVQRLHWHVQNASSVITILRRIRRHILTEWKPRNIVDSARLIQFTKRPSNNWPGRRGNGRFSRKDKKQGFFKNVRIECKKITWPDKETMFKQSVAVVAISVVLGVVIAMIDYVAKYGVNFLTSL